MLVQIGVYVRGISIWDADPRWWNLRHLQGFLSLINEFGNLWSGLFIVIQFTNSLKKMTDCLSEILDVDLIFLEFVLVIRGCNCSMIGIKVSSSQKKTISYAPD